MSSQQILPKRRRERFEGNSPKGKKNQSKKRKRTNLAARKIQNGRICTQIQLWFSENQRKFKVGGKRKSAKTTRWPGSGRQAFRKQKRQKPVTKNYSMLQKTSSENTKWALGKSQYPEQICKNVPCRQICSKPNPKLIDRNATETASSSRPKIRKQKLKDSIKIVLHKAKFDATEQAKSTKRFEIPLQSKIPVTSKISEQSTE